MPSSKNICLDGLKPPRVHISLPAFESSSEACHQDQSSRMTAVSWRERCRDIQTRTSSLPSIVFAFSSLMNLRPPRVSVSGMALAWAQASQVSLLGPFVDVSSISTGPSSSRYRVCVLWMRRSGVPASEPSQAPPLIRVENIGWRSSQKAFHSLWNLCMSDPKERKRTANLRPESCRRVTRWKRAGKRLYVLPGMPAALAAFELRRCWGSFTRFSAERSSLSISTLTGWSWTRPKVRVA
mmetsp:Transcript_25748/g.58623  ORF Transcript_25748/g.58623 Transcript_25748/m.58623 type:complete len:239 (-) Transcript_25748:472-1188(-)